MAIHHVLSHGLWKVLKRVEKWEEDMTLALFFSYQGIIMSPSQWLLCHSRMPKISWAHSKVSNKIYSSKEASTLDVSGFLFIDTIPGVWSGPICHHEVSMAEQLKQNIFFKFCCFWILPHIKSKMHSVCWSYLPLRGVSTGLSMCLRWSRLSCRLAIETTFLASFYNAALHLVRPGGRSQPSPLLGLEGSDLGQNFKEKGQKNITWEVWQELPAEGWRGWWPRRRETTWPGYIWIYDIYEECFIFYICLCVFCDKQMLTLFGLFPSRCRRPSAPLLCPT